MRAVVDECLRPTGKGSRVSSSRASRIRMTKAVGGRHEALHATSTPPRCTTPCGDFDRYAGCTASRRSDRWRRPTRRTVCAVNSTRVIQRDCTRSIAGNELQRRAQEGKVVHNREVGRLAEVAEVAPGAHFWVNSTTPISSYWKSTQQILLQSSPPGQPADLSPPRGGRSTRRRLFASSGSKGCEEGISVSLHVISASKRVTYRTWSFRPAYPTEPRPHRT